MTLISSPSFIITIMPFRFRATIVPKVLRQQAVHGLPRGPASQFDVDESLCKRLHDRLNAKTVPLVYNHTDHMKLGHVVCASMNASGGLDIEAETDESTTLGQEATKWIEGGGLCAVSLRHMTVVNEPEEVSLCWAGARGPEARCHSIYDSNTQSYKPINAPPVTISASGAPESTEELEFYPLSDLQTLTMTSVSASAPPAPVDPSPASSMAPPAASAAPSSSGFSLTSPEAAAGLASNPFSVDKIKALADSKIPSKEQRLEGQINATELAQALAKMQAEKEQYSKELEELREIKATKKREQEKKASELKDLHRKVVGDFEMTLAKTKEEQEAVPARISAMSDEMLETMYRTATRVKASLYPSMPQESEQEVQSRRLIRQYLGDKGIDTLKKEESNEMTDASAPASVSASYSAWGAKQAQAAHHTQVVFSQLANDREFWGKPLKTPPQTMVVQASAFSPHIAPLPQYRGNRCAEWKPGQGLNFNWSHLQPKQAAVYVIHNKVEMNNETKLSLGEMGFSRETMDAVAKYRLTGQGEYDRVMASKSSISDNEQLPQFLRGGGGLTWIENEYMERRRAAQGNR